MIMKSNYYFLLSYSPWPILCSLSSFNLLLSILILFKMGVFLSMNFSIMSICFCSFYWWMNYSKEMGLKGNTSMLMENGLKLGMVLFISSEIFFFFSFFWSYFHYFLNPSMETGMIWPPKMVIPFDYLNVPLINTLILLSSGISATLSHNFLLKNNKYRFSMFLALTIFLGVLFSFLQGLEYSSSFFSLSDSAFGTCFFMLTGFHGLHVIIGSIFLLTSLFISMWMTSSSDNLISFEMSSWYWHFVDVVWLFLYFFLYYLNS